MKTHNLTIRDLLLADLTLELTCERHDDAIDGFEAVAIVRFHAGAAADVGVVELGPHDDFARLSTPIGPAIALAANRAALAGDTDNRESSEWREPDKNVTLRRRVRIEFVGSVEQADAMLAAVPFARDPAVTWAPLKRSED